MFGASESPITLAVSRRWVRTSIGFALRFAQFASKKSWALSGGPGAPRRRRRPFIQSTLVHADGYRPRLIDRLEHDARARELHRRHSQEPRVADGRALRELAPSGAIVAGERE